LNLPDAATLSVLSDNGLSRQLRAGGLRLRTGPLVFCIRSRVAEVAAGLRALYGDYPLAPADGFADMHIGIERVAGLRRWLRPQIVFTIDGQNPFAPLPGDQGLPMLEWGMNWCVTSQCHRYLILHAAVLERNGRALVLPAPSGSGKSTLCAALLFKGWRLLSDELALIDPHLGMLVPMPRAVSLKNASIEVMQDFAGSALRYGSVVRDTVKGRVAHFAAPQASVRRAGELALPGWIVFPRYQAGAATSLQALPRGRCAMSLIENAFNYNLHQAAGFKTLTDLVSRSDCYTFTYQDLDQAMAVFEGLAAGVDSVSATGNAAATVGNAAATVGNAAATVGNAAATVGNAAATVGNAAATIGSAAAFDAAAPATAPGGQL
jgi:HprK-related kinase A